MASRPKSPANWATLGGLDGEAEDGADNEETSSSWKPSTAQ